MSSIDNGSTLLCPPKVSDSCCAHWAWWRWHKTVMFHGAVGSKWKIPVTMDCNWTIRLQSIGLFGCEEPLTAHFAGFQLPSAWNHLLKQQKGNNDLISSYRNWIPKSKVDIDLLYHPDWGRTKVTDVFIFGFPEIRRGESDLTESMTAWGPKRKVLCILSSTWQSAWRTDHQLLLTITLPANTSVNQAAGRTRCHHSSDSSNWAGISSSQPGA